MVRENEKRIVSGIVRVIDDMIATERAERWSLAAEKSLNGKILKKLPESVLSRLSRNLCADLTGTSPSSLLERFRE